MTNLSNDPKKEFLFKVNRDELGILEVETSEDLYTIDFDLRDGDYYINVRTIDDTYTRRYAGDFDSRSEALLSLIEDLSL